MAFFLFLTFLKSYSFRSLVTFALIILLISILIISYIYPDQSLYFESKYNLWLRYNLNQELTDRLIQSESFNSNYHILNVNHELKSSSSPTNKLSFDEIFNDREFNFHIRGNDVIVFLHIQKTGGTNLGRHLVHDLDLENPCECKRGRKRCKCVRPNSKAKLWLFSRYTTGWKCGLHADWTELTNCVENVMDESEKVIIKRRYFYITLLREPVSRFLSEFKHIQRGATWKNSLHFCAGRSPTPQELPPCYSGSKWTNVTLEKFMSCPFNLAINRQTRMLADLSLVGCYNRSFINSKDRDIILLESAKQNLKKMAFFGICEMQKISQYLFESTFKLHFLHPFIQLNETHSSLLFNELSQSDFDQIKALNHLDIQLYQFARQLLIKRFEKLKKLDNHFERNFIKLNAQFESFNLKNSNYIQDIFPEIRIINKLKKIKKKKIFQTNSLLA